MASTIHPYTQAIHYRHYVASQDKREFVKGVPFYPFENEPCVNPDFKIISAIVLLQLEEGDCVDIYALGTGLQLGWMAPITRSWLCGEREKQMTASLFLSRPHTPALHPRCIVGLSRSHGVPPGNVDSLAIFVQP